MLHGFHITAKIESIGSTTEIDTDEKRMNVMNRVISRLNSLLGSEGVELIIDTFDIDTNVKKMDYLNKIYAAIEIFTSNVERISTTNEIDDDVKLMAILNGIISTVNELGKFFNSNAIMCRVNITFFQC